MMLVDLEKYIFHPLVSKSYQTHKELTKNDFRPYLNYFGINFDSNGISSFKFYFPFFRRLKKEEIELFLPHSSDFMRYYDLWDESDFRSLEHSGCTFEVKFKHTITYTKDGSQTPKWSIAFKEFWNGMGVFVLEKSK